MANYPFSEESADNATAVEFTISDRMTTEFMASIEITTGTATAGTVGISVMPFGATEYQDLSGTIACTAPVPVVFDGRYQKIKFTPDSLDAGAKFTALLDSNERFN